ncbi:MAG: MFS transporter, partial [Chloroflexia bacterium]
VDESKGRDANKGIELDPLGIVLAALGLSALVFGLIEGPTYGWWTTKAQFTIFGFNWPNAGLAITPVMFALSLVFIVAFVLWEISVARKGKTPLFDFGLLRFKGFRFGLLTVLIVALGEFGILFILSIYYQSVRGLSAFDTGVSFLPLAIGSFIAAPSAGILSARFGAKWIVTIGMLIEAISIFLLGRIVGVDTGLWWFTPVLGLYGIGVGLAIAQLTNVTLSDIPLQYAGVGSGANNTVRQVGAAVGIAVLGALLTAQIASTGKERLAADTVIPSFIKAPIEQSLDSGLSGESFQTPTGPNGQTDPALSQAIKGVFDVAISEGVRSAATVASIFVLLGAVSSFLIPNTRKREEEAVGQQVEVGAHG